MADPKAIFVENPDQSVIELCPYGEALDEFGAEFGVRTGGADQQWTLGTLTTRGLKRHGGLPGTLGLDLDSEGRVRLDEAAAPKPPLELRWQETLLREFVEAWCEPNGVLGLTSFAKRHGLAHADYRDLQLLGRWVLDTIAQQDPPAETEVKEPAEPA